MRSKTEVVDIRTFAGAFSEWFVEEGMMYYYLISLITIIIVLMTIMKWTQIRDYIFKIFKKKGT